MFTGTEGHKLSPPVVFSLNMKSLLPLLIMSVIVYARFNRNIGIEWRNIDNTVSLITDLVDESKVNYNIVFVTTEPDLDIVHEVRSRANGMFTSSVFNYDNVRRSMIKKLNIIHMKENIPSLYIILQPKNRNEVQLKKVLKKIIIYENHHL